MYLRYNTGMFETQSKAAMDVEIRSEDYGEDFDHKYLGCVQLQFNEVGQLIIYVKGKNNTSLLREVVTIQ